MTKSTTLPAYNHSAVWGMFGYAGNCCDRAIGRDSAEMAKECWERGYMDYDTRMTVGTVGEECERRAPKVAAMLKKLGPVQCEPRRDEEFIEAVEVA
jgi:hypothetical protein